ncbi:MAG TPA: ribosome small subunit-dependent GTPase A, partial [Burkholderiaceae bacterium]|nr:ribosome small subunit-dependent GTPase A [Burkholderiaceae bacterium]
RAMIAVEAEGVESLVIATKSDLPQPIARIEPRLALYERLGYPVFRVSARHSPHDTVAALAPRLRSRVTLLIGESGMGKSTLVNTLVPQADLRTREISQALRAGRHTTTFTRAFELPEPIAGGTRSWLIDSPGYQTFALAHLSASQRDHAMREFAPLLGHCRFHNCRHRQEPGCAIAAAAHAGTIDPLRYRMYLRLSED